MKKNDIFQSEIPLFQICNSSNKFQKLMRRKKIHEQNIKYTVHI